MRNETKMFLKSLTSVNWFTKVGSLESGEVSVVKTLAKAKKYGVIRKWENFQLAPMNRLRDLIWDKTDFSEDDINQKAESISTSVFSFFQNSPECFLGEIILDDDILSLVRGDIQMIAFEVEYSHIFKPLFFYPVLWPWYERGHLPCGWDGKMISEDWLGNGPEDLPEGRLRVY